MTSPIKMNTTIVLFSCSLSKHSIRTDWTALFANTIFWFILCFNWHTSSLSMKVIPLHSLLDMQEAMQSCKVTALMMAFWWPGYAVCCSVWQGEVMNTLLSQ